MTKLPRGMSGKEVVKALQRAGFSTLSGRREATSSYGEILLLRR